MSDAVRITGELQCQTCREWPAGYVGRLGAEAWVACIRCREQAVRTKSEATYTPLGEVTVRVR